MNAEDMEEDIPPEERERLRGLIERLLRMGAFAIYGDESPDEPEALPDCTGQLSKCRARCCTYNFALTKDEVALGHILHNASKPFFIARDPDGYCPHIDRQTLRCEIWEQRPLRCRRFDCSNPTAP